MARIDIFKAADSAVAYWWRQTRLSCGPLILYVIAATLMALTPEKPSPAWLFVDCFALMGFCAGYVMGATALLRRALLLEGVDCEPAHGPFGFQWTPQEWRFITANMAALAAAAAPLMIVGLPVASLALMANEVSQAAAMVIGGVGGVLAVAAALHVAVRVSLAPAATVAQADIVLGWGLTKGRFWQVLGVYALAMLVAFIVLGVLSALGAALGLLFHDALASAEEGPMRAGAAVGYALGQAFVQLPLLAGASAYLYARLRPQAATV